VTLPTGVKKKKKELCSTQFTDKLQTIQLIGMSMSYKSQGRTYTL